MWCHCVTRKKSLGLIIHQSQVVLAVVALFSYAGSRKIYISAHAMENIDKCQPLGLGDALKNLTIQGMRLIKVPPQLPGTSSNLANSSPVVRQSRTL